MTSVSEDKATLRNAMRDQRRTYAAELPREVSALVFRQPPAPVRAMVPDGATIGIYRADPGEAPTGGYARYFFEAGHQLALPRVTKLAQPMRFHPHTDPYEESDLVPGVMGLMQPSGDLAEVVPQVLFMPLVAFTARGDRLGQGGGFYDRWLAAHPDTIAIGMAWDMQEVPDLPLEPHDMKLSAIVTPTRVLGPF